MMEEEFAVTKTEKMPNLRFQEVLENLTMIYENTLINVQFKFLWKN